MRCEEYLINNLTEDNFENFNIIADMYNAERLRDYCSWYYRRHYKALMGFMSDNSFDNNGMHGGMNAGIIGRGG